MSEEKKNTVNKDDTGENSGKRLEGVAMGIHHFGGPTEEAGNYRQTWSKLVVYCKEHMPKITLAIILTVIGNICQVSVPGLLRAIVDEIRIGLTGSINTQALANVAITLGCLYLCTALMSFLQNFTMASVTSRISKNLRVAISEKINRLPLKYFDRVSLGDVISRVTNDVDTIGQTLNQNIGMLISASTQFLGSLILMLISNLTLALTAVGMSAIGFLASKIVMSHSQKYFRGQQRGLGAVNGHIDEIFSGHNVVMAYNGAEAAQKTFDGINGELYGAAWKANFVSGFITPLMNFSGSIAYVSICVVGALLVLQNRITFGVIVAFLIYVDQFTQGLTHIAETVPGLQGTTAASERVFELLDEEELDDESHKTAYLGNVSGHVAFRNLSFGYSQDKTIIHDFSAEVKSGQKIAIVGPTGAGKTTIVNLLMRFYEPDGGEILIDGMPISQATRENVRDQLGMVLQDAWLFEGTLKQNVVYNKAGVTDQQVEEVCKAVGLHHFISTLPMGYDTMLNSSVSLSEGQKQLITIARAMIQNAPILILDEATSSVDTRTEALIQEAMDRLMAGRTSFVIAHRLSTIRDADLILVLKDGDVIERGAHAELLAQNGFYTELYNSQFGLTA
ncbi:MAG: ABC transporter ATP-binding protein/permease [Peptococcaceae bacterium]|jgi:ATP-binding cassette subfamily B protein|nr:ABC transporter ATP-binding protein/permease [Peptococcaceae bacterium]